MRKHSGVKSRQVANTNALTYPSVLHTFFACVCLWLFSITHGATIPFLDLSTTLLSFSATFNMFTHPDEFNYIFSEEITVEVAQPARGQH